MDELLYKQEVFQLVGFCMDIHRELGKGHDEVIYKDALVVELSRAGVTTIDLLHPGNPPNTVQPTTFLDGLLDLTCNEINTLINGTLFNWNLKLKAKGDSDLYVTQHTFQPGQHSGTRIRVRA